MTITLDTGDCTQAKDNSFWALYIALSSSFITWWLKHLQQGWGAAVSKRSLEFWMIHPCHVIEKKFTSRKSTWFKKCLWMTKTQGFWLTKQSIVCACFMTWTIYDCKEKTQESMESRRTLPTPRRSDNWWLLWKTWKSKVKSQKCSTLTLKHNKIMLAVPSIGFSLNLQNPLFSKFYYASLV